MIKHIIDKIEIIVVNNFCLNLGRDKRYNPTISREALCTNTEKTKDKKKRLFLLQDLKYKPKHRKEKATDIS